MTDPQINLTPHSELQKELSIKLNNLVQECEILGDSSGLHSEISQNFNDFSQKLENLKLANFFQVTQKTLRSQNIDNYVKQKFHSQDSTVKSPRIFQFSFEEYKNGELSRLVSRQKRKFGRYLNETSKNFQVKLPELEVKSFDVMRNRKEKKIMVRNDKLDGIIKEFLGKKLGLKAKVVPKIQKSPKEAEKILKKVKNPKYAKKPSELDEDFNHDYYRYLHNPSIRLKLEKILISQHIKNRKSQYVPN